MRERIRCIEMQHINIVTNDFELFVPHQFILNARYGPHYLGIEYQVGDAGETRDWFRERGVGLVRDIGIAIHTDPADTIGVAWEFFDQSFHRGSPVEWLEPLHPTGHWRDHHPTGLLGLKRYSIVVGDATAALAFFEDTFEHRRIRGATSHHRSARHRHPTRRHDHRADNPDRRRGNSRPPAPLRRRHQVSGLPGGRPQATERHFSQLGIELVARDHSDTLAIRPRTTVA